MTLEVYNLRPANASPGRVGRRYRDGERFEAVATPPPYQARHVAMLGNATTPERMAALLTDRNQGYLQAWVDFANETRRNSPHLHNQLAIRELSVAETTFEVQPGKGSNQQAAKKAAGACKELLEHWQGLEGSGWEQWLAEWVAGAFYGRHGHELFWARDGAEVLIDRLERIDERRLSLACDREDPDPWALRLWDCDLPGAPRYGTKLRDFHPDKILWGEPRVLGGLKTAEGLFSVVVWYCVFALWSWRDLMALSEMMGRPPAVAYYAAGGQRAGEFDGSRLASDADIAAALAVVNGLAGSMRAVLPDTTKVALLSVPQTQGTPVQLLSEERANALISKAVNGVANLTDLQPGARAAVESQERTSYTYWRSDCRRVERIVRSLFARYVRANPQRFGAECPLPVVRAQTDPPKDRVAFFDGLDRARKVGVTKIGKQWAYNEGGIPMPEDDEELLEAPAPPPAPPPAPVGSGPNDPVRELPAQAA